MFRGHDARLSEAASTWALWLDSEMRHRTRFSQSADDTKVAMSAIVMYHYSYDNIIISADWIGL